jgi:hypothetical protein
MPRAEGSLLIEMKHMSVAELRVSQQQTLVFVPTTQHATHRRVVHLFTTTEVSPVVRRFDTVGVDVELLVVLKQLRSTATDETAVAVAKMQSTLEERDEFLSIHPLVLHHPHRVVHVINDGLPEAVESSGVRACVRIDVVAVDDLVVTRLKRNDLRARKVGDGGLLDVADVAVQHCLEEYRQDVIFAVQGSPPSVKRFLRPHASSTGTIHRGEDCTWEHR